MDSSDEADAERPVQKKKTKSAKPVAPQQLDPPTAPAAPAHFRQTTLQPRITLKELAADDPLVSCQPVGPQLTPANAGGRFVLTPPDVFQVTTGGGWTGKIVSVARDAVETTKVKYHDGTRYFKFSFVLERFKPLTTA